MLSGQVLRLGRDAVEGVPQRNRPGKVLKGLPGFAFKVEAVRRSAGELEGSLSLPLDGGRAVGEVDHLVIGSVVREGVRAVEGIAFYDAAFQKIAVIVQGGVIRFIVGGRYTVADGFRRCRDGAGSGQGRRQNQSGDAVLKRLPGHIHSSK